MIASGGSPATSAADLEEVVAVSISLLAESGTPRLETVYEGAAARRRGWNCVQLLTT